MNAKQRKQRDKQFTRIAKSFVDLLGEIADELESGELTHEEFIREIRQAQQGWKGMKVKE